MNANRYAPPRRGGGWLAKFIALTKKTWFKIGIVSSLFLVAIVIVVVVIWPCAFWFIPGMCPERLWKFEAAAFADAPTEPQVFEACKLAEVGFSETDFDLATVKANLENIPGRIKAGLETRFPTVFVPAGISSIASVDVIVPSESVETVQTLRIMVRRIPPPPPEDDPKQYDDEKRRTYVRNELDPLINQLDTQIANRANGIKDLAPSHGGRDLPLLLLIQAELTAKGMTWEFPEHLGPVSVRSSDHFKRFVEKSYESNDGHINGRYDESYAYWLDALVTLKSRKSSSIYAADWNVRLNQLGDLSGAYKSATEAKSIHVPDGTYKLCRVDGSVLTLAVYTILTLQLEGWNKVEGDANISSIRQALDQHFVRIATNLRESMRLLENRGPSDLEYDKPTLTYFSGPGRQIYGGRLLYFCLAAELEEDPAKKIELLRLARNSRDYFKENSGDFKGKKLDPYLYCYLVRAAATNARICAQNEIDNWAEEWTDFLDDCNGRCAQRSEFSNFYRILGELAARNTLSDGKNEPTSRWRTGN